MSLRLYDTAAREVRDFVPLVPGEVGVYVCGATVQSSPHVGHLRPAVAFDVLSRWLTRSGYHVTLIRNVTDIDDKVLAKSAAAGQPWWAWALRHEREFEAAYDAVGVLPSAYAPRATGHVTDMVELVEQLELELARRVIQRQREHRPVVGIQVPVGAELVDIGRQRVAAHHHPPAHDVVLRRLAVGCRRARQQDIAWRQLAAARILRRRVRIDELEGHLRRFTDDFLNVLGIIDTRQL